MIPARGPQIVCLMQSLFCNHSAIFALQSFVMQSLLCNCCYAILAMQSLLCSLYYAIFAMQPLLCNLCFPLSFELRLHKTLQNLCFLQYLAEHLKNVGFPLFFALRLQKTLQNQCFLQYFADNIEKPMVFLCFLHSYRKKH